MAIRTRASYETHVEPYLALVKSMRIDGAKEEDIALELGIGISTWYKYKTLHEELVEALKYTKKTLIAKLEDTLFQQALKGNTTALIFSLKNLAPSRWGDKIDVSGSLEIKEFSKMLDKFIDKL